MSNPAMFSFDQVSMQSLTALIDLKQSMDEDSLCCKRKIDDKETSNGTVGPDFSQVSPEEAGLETSKV
jgi:hypothetical protein